MKIYLENGYVDIRKILSTKIPFIFLVGGRGSGKTYGALKEMVESKEQFIFMRRTQTQTDLINKPQFSPFKSINRDLNIDIGSMPISKYNSGFYHQYEEDGKKVCEGNPIGYSCALSTISNMRGFDASDVKYLIYDEFIPEKHERPLKNEASAFFNAYETINRNRELTGETPLQVLCMANANDLANPLFLDLGLVKKAEQMKRKGQEVYINRDKGVALFILNSSEISEKKSNTALYRLTKGSQFEKMSIGNEFSSEEIGRIGSRPLNEYRPIVSIGELCIYEHKSNRSYYASTHRTGSPVTFTMGDTDRIRFKKSHFWLWDEYLENNIIFEEYLCEILLTKSFK